MSEPGPAHLSPLSLDLLLLGDLGDADGRSARQHLDRCPDCRERYGVLQREAQRFSREVYPRTLPKLAERMAKQTAERIAAAGAPEGEDENEGENEGEDEGDTAGAAAPTGRPRPWRRALAAAAGAGAIALALVFVVRPAASPRPAPGPGGDLLEKGGASLTVYVRRAQGGVSMLADGERVAPGDALRFAADPGGSRHLLIAGIDASGRATVYLPYHGQASAAIAPHRRFEDDGAIVLDDTRGPERLFALFSGRPLDAGDVTRALAALGAGGPAAIRKGGLLPVAADAQASLLLEK